MLKPVFSSVLQVYTLRFSGHAWLLKSVFAYDAYALRHRRPSDYGRDGQCRPGKHAYVAWAVVQKTYVPVCALSVRSCFSGGWWHDEWPVSVSEQSESVMMLIRWCFSRPTPPCLITVFFLYPEYQVAVKEDKCWFYIYSLPMLWNYITYWNRVIKEAPTCRLLLFARHRNAPGSVIDEVWNNPSTISDRELIVGWRKCWCCQKSFITFMNSFLKLPWSDHPSLTKESCDTWSSGDPPRRCRDSSRPRLSRQRPFKRVYLCKQRKQACLVLCSHLPN